MKNKKIKRHYYIGGLPLIFFLIIFHLLNIKIEYILFFLVSYIWNFTLSTPYLFLKIEKPNYRFSFMRSIYILNKFLGEIFSNSSFVISKRVIRSISPFIFVCVLAIFFNKINPLWGILGSFIFEVIYYWDEELVRRKSWFSLE